MNLKKKNARIAGLWYLLLAITGAFGIMYVPTAIMVEGNANATAQRIIESGWVYRVSIFSNLVSQVSFIFLVLSLKRLLEEVDPGLANLMLTLVTVAVPIAFINTLNLIAAQLLVSGAGFLKTFELNELNTLSMLFLKIYEQGILVVQIFWGLWLLPLGLLIMRSKLIPGFIGVFLVIGCFAYLLSSLIGLLFPAYQQIAAPILILPISIGEFSIIVWLLGKGVKEQKI